MQEKTIAQLPFDLSANILLRLPLETLIRFARVSKQCYSLISDPLFVNLHRQKWPPELRFLYIECVDENLRSLPTAGGIRGIHGYFRFTSTDTKGKVLQQFVKKGSIYGDRIREVYSCDDLICFSAQAWGPNPRQFLGDSEQIYLCNPTTQKLVILPQYSQSERLLIRRLEAIGFGYLSTTEEYKVMRIFKCYPGSSMRCEILSCTGGRRMSCSSWRNIDEKCPLQLDGNCKMVFAHGCLNWVAKSCRRRKGAIVSFDLISEKFRILPAPFDDSQEISLLCSAGGKLSFTDDSHLDRDGRMDQIRVWVLEDYDNCLWIKASKTCLSPTINKYVNKDFLELGVRVRVVDNELLITLGDDNCDEDYSGWNIIHLYYSIARRTFRRVKFNQRIRMVDTPDCERSLGFYWESLVSLRSP